MAVNLSALVKDRRVLYAGGAGVALGAVALIKKRSAATAPSTGGTAAAPGYTPGSLGAYDSSGTDAYNNLNNELNGRLDEFGKQITDLQDQLARTRPGTGTSGGSGQKKPRPIDPPRKGTPKPKVPPRLAGTIYVVKRGETLGAIAKRNKTTVTHLAQVNHISNPNRIQVGQKIRVR